jgi:hypothetical protein
MKITGRTTFFITRFLLGFIEGYVKFPRKEIIWSAFGWSVNHDRGFIPDVSPCSTRHAVILQSLTRKGHTLFELFLQKQGITRAPCVLLDLVRLDKHCFCFSRVRHSSSSWPEWLARVALALCNWRWPHWPHWRSFMVSWRFETCKYFANTP